jgi:hypothetical protein
VEILGQVGEISDLKGCKKHSGRMLCCNFGGAILWPPVTCESRRILVRVRKSWSYLGMDRLFLSGAAKVQRYITEYVNYRFVRLIFACLRQDARRFAQQSHTAIVTTVNGTVTAGTVTAGNVHAFFDNTNFFPEPFIFSDVTNCMEKKDYNDLVILFFDSKDKPPSGSNIVRCETGLVETPSEAF